MKSASASPRRAPLPDAARLDPAIIRELSRLSPLRGAAAIAGDWAAIIGAAALCWTFWHPAVYLLTIAFIGARQHDLMLLVHEAAHFRLFRSKRVNDWASDLLLAWPFLVSTTASYRAHHSAHHRHLNTARDPDFVRKQGPSWTFPMSRGRLAALLVTDALGLGLPRTLAAARQASGGVSRSRGYRIARVCYGAGLLLAVHTLGLWIPVLLFWIVPFLTWTQLVMHVRSIAEHHALPEDALGGTRTVHAGLLDRLLLLNHNACFHAEHHLYPSVPFYNLPRLHARLMARPEYRARAHVTTGGYLGVLRECVARPASARRVTHATPRVRLTSPV